MAERYGGKYSPGGDPRGSAAGNRSPLAGLRPSRAGMRVNLLFLAPLPLIWKGFRAEPIVMAQYFLAFGLIIGAAWMTREGLRAEEAFDARRVARRPALPRKIFGAGLMGMGLGLAGIAGYGPLEAVIFAAMGAVLHLFAFGLDPLRDKGAGADSIATQRVARAVEEAETHLGAMTKAIRQLGDRRLESRLSRFQAVARDMFRTVEEDPRDLPAARRYLGVYLIGARDATTKFADIYAKTRDPQARADYEALLSDLEKNFEARHRSLLLDNRTDLDVEIEVLRERLEREGVHPD